MTLRLLAPTSMIRGTGYCRGLPTDRLRRSGPQRSENTRSRTAERSQALEPVKKVVTASESHGRGAKVGGCAEGERRLARLRACRRKRHDAPMRQVFAHDAVLTMGQHEDERAPGAAITEALCGSSQHEPPCLLAPHHTSSQRSGEEVQLRVLFAAEPGSAAEVHQRIDQALARGAMGAPNGAQTTWRLQKSAGSLPRPDEEDHGRRLVSD